MRILHTVEFYHPSVGGMQEVVKQLSERLVALGHEVTVATSVLSDRKERLTNGVKIEDFLVNGNAVSGYQGDVSGYERFLLKSNFDVIVNFAAQQWTTDIALPLLSQIACRKVFVPTGFSGLFATSYRKYFSQLPKYMRQYDMNVFHSDNYRDIAFARKHGIKRTILIPNGAAADEFLVPVSDTRSQLGIPPNHFLILHVGSHTGLKGHEEAMEIFSKADIHNATLLIVGNETPDGCGSTCRNRSELNNLSARFHADGKLIISTQMSRSDTVSAYHAADLFLFPSNIECSPIVLFECMASRTPFLVTDVGNSSEIIDWSGGAGVLLPLDSPAFLPCYGTLASRLIEKLRIKLGLVDYIDTVRADIRGSLALIERLYRDAAGREKMSQAGFLAWQKRFTWEKIAGEYDALYRNLVEGEA